MAGRTSLIISHNLLTVTDADEIVVLDGGAVSAVGRHEELLATSPIYAHLYALHQAPNRIAAAPAAAPPAAARPAGPAPARTRPRPRPGACSAAVVDVATTLDLDGAQPASLGAIPAHPAAGGGPFRGGHDTAARGHGRSTRATAVASGRPRDAAAAPACPGGGDPTGAAADDAPPCDRFRAGDGTGSRPPAPRTARTARRAVLTTTHLGSAAWVRTRSVGSGTSSSRTCPTDLRERIEVIAEKSGFVPNVFRALARSPASSGCSLITTTP